MMITAYTPEAYREFLLPSEKNLDYHILLAHRYFGLHRDLLVSLENIGGCWKICPGSDYDIYCGSVRLNEAFPMSGEEVLRIVTRDGEDITFLPRTVDRPLAPFRKIHLKDGTVIRIGRGSGNEIRYNNRDLVAREHAVLAKEGETWKITCCSSNGMYVNGEFSRMDHGLCYGDCINILGLSLIFLGDCLAVNALSGNTYLDGAALSGGYGEGMAEQMNRRAGFPSSGRLFHRSPRFLETLEEGTIEIDDPPQSMVRDQGSLLYTVGPSLTMVLPMACGSFAMMYAMRRSGGGNGFFFYSGLVMAGTSAAVSVLWALLNRRRQQREEEHEEEQRFVSYSAYLLEKKEEIQKLYRKNREIMNRMYPHVSEVLQYDKDSAGLWSRNPDQADFLSHRVGTGDIPFQVRIKAGKKNFRVRRDPLSDKAGLLRDNFETLQAVPITIDLLRFRKVGIISDGTGHSSAEIARLLMIQMAANNCYTDVKLVVVYNGDNPDECAFWSFARWLPHVWSEDRKTRYMASDKKEAGDIFFELSSVFRRRVREQEKSSRNSGLLPYYIFIIADPGLIGEEAICGYIFDHAEECGLSAVFLAESYDALPNTCELFAEDTESFSGIYEASGRNVRTKVAYDTADTEACVSFSRNLCGTEVQHVRGEGKIPLSLSFLDMYQVSGAEELFPHQRWLKNRTYENIKGFLGRKAGDALMVLDIHEKYHGPHGLVAGMTGSGKSETLQTLILSLAVNYSPDDIAFFIIDYKGGGLANQFAGLPHIAGSISNLSGNRIRRAMASIKSENRYRQRLLGKYQMNHIDQYTRMFKSGECTEPMPHLVIVIDEFAELKKEEPDCMQELISVAQVGRSLGVHLILATQKPGGVVDESIRSNSRFRLCLRVQNRQDSLDMLGKADASEITGTGRCCFQVGNDEIYEQFQSGWSGASCGDGTKGASARVRMISLTGRPAAVLPHRTEDQKTSGAGRDATQLDAVRNCLIRTAKEYGYRNSRLLWLPPLPEKICLKDLPGYGEPCGPPAGQPSADERGNGSVIVRMGLVDVPDRQAQETLAIEYPEAGNLAVCGTVVSGKSTFLQTFLTSLVTGYPPDRVNVYGIDCSGRSMEEFGSAPHVGGLMYDDPEKLRRFFLMLEKLSFRRKEAFRAGSSRSPEHEGKGFPSVFILIDHYASFREKTADAYEAEVLRISREGPGLGIFLVIAAAGFSMNEIGSRLRENIRTVVCLGAEDRFSCADMFRTSRIETLPPQGIRGRGLALFDEKVREFQTALAYDSQDDFERQEKIRGACERAADRYRGSEAARVPEIPQRPVWEEFIAEAAVQQILKTGSLLPAGYRADDGEIFTLDMRENFCYLAAGERGSGKTNFLKVLIGGAERKGMDTIVIDCPSRPLYGYADRSPGDNGGRVLYTCTEEEILDCFGNYLTPILKERSPAGKEPMKYILIVISDLEYLLSMAYKSGKNMQGFLEMLFGRGSGYGLLIAGELSMDKRHQVTAFPAFRSFVSVKKGIHFGGKTINNTLLCFEHMDYKEQNRSMRPGLALIPEQNGGHAAERILVPLVEEQT